MRVHGNSNVTSGLKIRR